MKSRTIELKFNITNLIEFCIFFLFFFLAERRKGAGCVVEARPVLFEERNETDFNQAKPTESVYPDVTSQSFLQRIFTARLEVREGYVFVKWKSFR